LRLRVLAPVWLALVWPRSSHWGRVVKFNSQVSCTMRIVGCALQRRSVCVRWACRRLATSISGASVLRKREQAWARWASAPVAQLAAAKLLLGPALALEAVVRFERGPRETFHAEPRVKVIDQRIQVNVLASLAGVVRAVAPSTLGSADVHPVCRLVAGAFI